MNSTHSIYLDHAATTQMASEVAHYLSSLYAMNLSNPSATHSAGQAARDLVEQSRRILADRIHSQPSEIVFTSGGTEGNNWILQRVADDARLSGIALPLIVTSAIEHSSINRLAAWMEKRKLIEWKQLEVDSMGRVRPEALSKVLSTPQKPSLVSIGHANNEIGVIQDVIQIGKLCREASVLFHSDACQTFCHIPIDVRDWPVDFLTLNSHKIRGPKGIGAMYVRSSASISPLLIGGLQESGHRSGTIPVELIAGFAKASQLWVENTETHISEQKKFLLSELEGSVGSFIVNGPAHDDAALSLQHVLSITIPNRNSRELVAKLSQIGIHCSAGAACNSGSFDASAVLLALGRAPEDAHHLRISFGASTQKEDCMGFVNGLRSLLN